MRCSSRCCPMSWRSPRPGRRPSITSLAQLAAHLGRELSVSAVDANGWTDLQYAAALELAGDGPGAARGRGAAGARLRADRESLGPASRTSLSGCGQDWFAGTARPRSTSRRSPTRAKPRPPCFEGGADPEVADATSATPPHGASGGVGGRLDTVARGGPEAGLAVGDGIAGPQRRPPGPWTATTPLGIGSRRRCIEVRGRRPESGLGGLTVDAGRTGWQR